MKRTFLVLCLLMSTSYLVKSQTQSDSQKIAKPKTFVIKLQTVKKTNYGFLSGLNDSIIEFSSKRTTFSGSTIEKRSYQTYNYADINKVRIRKYGKVGKGLEWGAAIGGGIGGIAGLLSYDKTNDWFGPGIGALAGSIAGALSGLIVGGLLGSKMIKFNIHRDQEKFRLMKAAILEMSLTGSDNDSPAANYLVSSLK